MRWPLFFHILGVILWAGGVLNLSRMLGFHVQEELEVQARLSEIEMRILFFVTIPGMMVAIAAGMSLLEDPVMHYSQFAWMKSKLYFVLIFVLLTIELARRVIRLQQKPEKKPKRPYMILHGLLGLVMVAILSLVILQPF